MRDTKSKIGKIVLNTLGAWLEIQMPIPVVKMCDRACQDRAKQGRMLSLEPTDFSHRLAE
jgi:hypothetical protein